MQFAAKSARIHFVADADIAQSVERILGKDEVPGPNPGSSSRRNPVTTMVTGFFGAAGQIRTADLILTNFDRQNFSSILFLQLIAIFPVFATVSRFF